MKKQNDTMILDVIDCGYSIGIGKNNNDEIKAVLAKYKDSKVLVVTDKNVNNLYGSYMAEILQGLNYSVYAFSPGEESKSLVTYEQILQKLSEENFTRQDLIIAFGGGIPGDIAGFAASTYLRGIKLISIPTTLLAMVDSSVGGKNGVNLNHLKNQVGTFYFPNYVHIDIDFLKTLAEKEIHNGLAEVFKYAILTDEKLFSTLEKPLEKYEWIGIIAKCLEIKLDYVKDDVKDHGKRQFLNLGHTFAHAIEALSCYGVNHGSAVGVGMIYMARAAYRLGYAKEDISKKIVSVFKQHGMLTEYLLDEAKTIDILRHDKKIRGEKIAMIVPIKIGEVIRKIMPVDEVKKWIREGQNDEN